MAASSMSASSREMVASRPDRVPRTTGRFSCCCCCKANGVCCEPVYGKQLQELKETCNAKDKKMLDAYLQILHQLARNLHFLLGVQVQPVGPFVQRGEVAVS